MLEMEWTKVGGAMVAAITAIGMAVVLYVGRESATRNPRAAVHMYPYLFCIMYMCINAFQGFFLRATGRIPKDRMCCKHPRNLLLHRITQKVNASLTCPAWTLGSANVGAA